MSALATNWNAFDKSEWDFNKSNEDFKTAFDNSPQAV